MAIPIIITFCSLLLVAYVFNLTASKTKIPSVILLLLLGWGIRKILILLEFELPDFSNLLPVLATMGLVLVVLEGALEVELSKSKIGLVKKSIKGALFPMIILSLLFATLFYHYGQTSFKISLINAIPFCIISSAIAIPCAVNLSTINGEYVTYESSLSDILGVLFFNFMVINNTINIYSFGNFGLQLLIILAVTFVATIGLALLLSKIKHHVKFVPIILIVILIYAVSKIYHLPALIFILIFGLTIGNLGELKRLKWVRKFNSDEIKIEIQKFKELTIEGAFLIRALFFILFGYLLKESEILNTETMIWSISIVGIIYVFRAIQLKLSNLKLVPLLFIAPRGLITILLFLKIEPVNSILLVNKSLIIQVIILTTLIMAFGIMMAPKKSNQEK